MRKSLTIDLDVFPNGEVVLECGDQAVNLTPDQVIKSMVYWLKHSDTSANEMKRFGLRIVKAAERAGAK